MFFSGLEYRNENNTSFSDRWSKYALMVFLKWFDAFMFLWYCGAGLLPRLKKMC